MSTAESNEILFSQQLEEWLQSNKPKTFGGLVDVFAEKSFAITFILLMAVPALPLPTGGITHVFEVIVILMSAQMAVGFQKFWLPKKLKRTKLNSLTHPKTVSKITKLIHWFERHSKPRMVSTIKSRVFISISALIVLVFSVFAFISPPFSGLDTLPSLGVVVVSLGLLLEDMLIVIFGILIGVFGIGLMIFLSDVILKSALHLFGH